MWSVSNRPRRVSAKRHSVSENRESLPGNFDIEKIRDTVVRRNVRDLKLPIDSENRFTVFDDAFRSRNREIRSFFEYAYRSGVGFLRTGRCPTCQFQAVVVRCCRFSHFSSFPYYRPDRAVATSRRSHSHSE